jgi:hypothetical protein
MTVDLKTAEQWERLVYPSGPFIYDPDGWRGRGREWTDLITRDEFEARRMECTLMGKF